MTPRPATPDRGATGKAQSRRPATMVAIALPVEVSPGYSRLQRAEVLRYADVHLVDSMARAAQLCDRQHANAAALLSLWRAAGLEPRMTADLGAGPRGRALDRDDGEAAAEDHFHREMKRFGSEAADLLGDMLRGKHPGVRFLATLQSALDRLDHLPARWGGEMWTAEEGR